MGRKPAKMKGNQNEEYTFPSHESNCVHAKIIVPQFDPQTGKPKTGAFTQKYNPKAWAQFLKNPVGNKVEEVLHLPEGCDMPEYLLPQEAPETEGTDEPGKTAE